MLSARRFTSIYNLHSTHSLHPGLCRTAAWPAQAPAAVVAAAAAAAAAIESTDCCHSRTQQLRRSHQHILRRRTVAAASAAGDAPAAAGAAQQAASAAGLQQQQLPDGVDPEQLLAALSRITTYTQLSAFVQSQSEVFLHTPLCVYAILHAVQLRDTLSFDRFGQGSLASEEAIMQQLELVAKLLDQLCAAAVNYVPALPLLSQATLTLALAQLEFYDPPLINALAEAAKAALAQPPQTASPDSNSSSSNSDSNNSSSSDSGSSSSGEAFAKAAGLEELPEGLVPGVLLSLAVACSMNGHYDPQLLDRVAEQAVAFRSTFPTPGPLISIAAALLDLQHDHPPLLAAAAAAAAAAEDPAGELQVEEVISLLLAVGFFRVAAPDFTTQALQTLGEAGEQLCELDGVQVSRLWRALLLLRDDGVELPQELLQAVSFAAEQLLDVSSEEDPEAAADAAAEAAEAFLLGGCRAEPLLAALEDFGPALSYAPEGIRQQWEASGMASALTVLDQLQGLGYRLEQGVTVAAVSPDQQQQQQQGAEEACMLPPAQVDLSFVVQGKQGAPQQHVAVVLLFDDRYCITPRNRLRGSAAVDILALQALGLSVLPLPLQEWQALADSTPEQQRYLKARVAAATS